MKKSRMVIKSGIELAAMVDVVFLLITFFLVNSSITRNPSIKIDLPKSLSAKVDDQQNIIIHVDENNLIYINSDQVKLEELPALLKIKVKNPEEDQIVIKGDKKSSYQTIISIMDQVSQAGIVHFNLATEH